MSQAYRTVGMICNQVSAAVADGKIDISADLDGEAAVVD